MFPPLSRYSASTQMLELEIFYVVRQISDIFCENCAIDGKSIKIGIDVH